MVVDVRTMQWQSMLMDEKLEPVNPVKHDDREGRESYEYGYHKADIGEVSSQPIDGVTAIQQDDALLWQYENKPPVVLTNDGRAYKLTNADRKESERQAYYSLSFMESQGLVDGWTRT